jgi:hypothetical protein
MPRKSLIAIASAMLLAGPPFAVASGPPSEPGNSARAHAQRTAARDAEPPGPDASAATKAKAYGLYCQDESKKHVKGKKGTPFSRCVTAMAKLASGKASTPAQACARLSKKRVKGQTGTPYGRCVAAAARLASDASVG